MRKIIYTGLAAIMIGLMSTACTDQLTPAAIEKENLVPEKEKTMVFQASLEQPEAATKTSLDGLNVVWTEGDKIRIFNHSHQDGVVFTLKAGDGGKTSGTFEGSDIGTGPYYAIYPASAAEGLAIPFTESPLAINAVVEANQTYVAGSFGNGANVAVAAAADMNLSFKNVFGSISFTLTGTSTITKINIYTRESEILNGYLQVTDLETDAPVGVVSAEVKEANLYKSLSCGAGVTLNTTTGETFYITVPVGAFANGFYVEFIDSEGNALIKSVKGTSNVIRRSGITAMPAFTYAPSYKAAFLEETGSFGAFTNVGSTGAYTKPFNFVPGGTSQYASDFTTTGDGTRTIRFQDWTVGYAVTLDIDKYNLPLNSTPSVAVKALGATGGIVTHEGKAMKVVKRVGDRVWLFDNTDGAGKGDGFILTLTD